jgi:hypothetical protein
MIRPICKTLFVATASVICINATNAEASILNYFTDLSSFDTTTSTTLVEDFEAISPFPTLFSSFTNNNITYTAFAGELAGQPFPNVTVTPPGFLNFGVPITTSSILVANGNEDFTVEFEIPKPVVGFNTYLNQFGPATIQIFGSGKLLDTYILEQDPTIVGFFGVVANEPITSIRWTTVNGRKINTGIDNIRIGNVRNDVSIPEPSMIPGLLGLAIGVLSIRTLKKV